MVNLYYMHLTWQFEESGAKLQQKYVGQAVLVYNAHPFHSFSHSKALIVIPHALESEERRVNSTRGETDNRGENNPI